MLRVLILDRPILVATAAALLAASAMAQTCDTILGGANCSAPGASRVSPNTSDQPWATRFSTQSLGRDLSPGGSDTGFFAGITIGGGGLKCSGLFRSRDCLR